MSSNTLPGSGDKMNIEQIKKNLAKRTFSVNFDLGDSEYRQVENIGIGAYGVVCSAIHKKSKDKVAIKKIPHVFEAVTVTKRTYREIKILKHFKHDNIIRIREILKPKEARFQEIYVVFDLMESDLHRIIYTDQELTEEHIRYFLYQILRGLKYIHSANVIHRDLKPSNLLVNEDCHVRIGDFGMARGISQTPDEPCYYMTQYVATRWYRAPEILLSLVEYGPAVDMWSVGCIFAEMLGRKHLFPGKNYLSQIKLIVGILGSPSETVLNGCHNDIIRRIMKSLGPKQAVAWKNLFPKASKKAIDLLSKMLTINPEERITAETALEHLFLSKYHDPDDEPICVPTFNFDFEKKELTKIELHDAIYKEIMEFHQPKTPTLSFNAVLRPAPKPDSPQPSMVESVTNLSLETHPLVKEEDQTAGHLPCDVSKTPDVPNTQVPVVCVDTSALIPPQCVDVEMLSARSADGQADIQTGLKPEKREDKIPPQKAPTQQAENKTISSDTKALIKQALLNASQRRQRTESSSEDQEGKTKVVTAAQRQKEREEKRKKKKDKANERLKKQREKQNITDKPLLSSEDKELLKRWASMQTKIAPAPQASQALLTGQTVKLSFQGSVALTSTSQAQPTSIQVQSGQQGVVPSVGITIQSGQQPLIHPANIAIQAQQQPVGQPTSITLQSGQQTLGQPTQDLQLHHTASLIQAGTLPSHPPAVIPTHDVKTDISPQQSCMTQASRETCSPPQHGQAMSTGPYSLQQHTQNLSLVDPVPVLLQTTSQIPVNIGTNQPYNPGVPVTHTVTNSCMFLSSTMTPAASFSVPEGNVRNQTTLPSQIQTSNPPSCILGGSQSSFCHTPPQHTNFTHSGTDLDISALDSNTHQSDTVNSSAFPTIDFDGLDFFKDMVHETNSSPGTTVQPAFDFEPYPDQLPQLRTSPPKNLEGSDCNYQPRPQFPPHSSASLYTTPQQAASSAACPHQSFTSTTMPFSSYNQPASTFLTGNVHTAVAEDMTGSGGGQSKPALDRSPPPPLKISCNRLGGKGEQPDFIALLTKQFSKSHVEDIMPPALSLTPKGTGGGYGVGADLDSLMVDNQDFSARLDQSPLSSSLIADWMDLRGNISLADLEALERELEIHSPMAVSYSDLNLHHS